MSIFPLLPFTVHYELHTELNVHIFICCLKCPYVTASLCLISLIRREQEVLVCDNKGNARCRAGGAGGAAAVPT